MKFPGKRALWWYLVLIALGVACGFTIYALVLEPGIVTAASAGLIVVVALFAFSIQFRNELVLEEEKLLLKFGPVTRRIPYIQMRSIERTRNPISSTATSLDRIAIELMSGGLYLVSSTDNDRLMEELYLRRKMALRGD